MSNRLSPLDAAFLDAEDEDSHASMAIASVAVLERPVPTQEEIIQAIGGRLPLVPRYRQKLRTVPFDLGRPAWVDDPDFDLAYHVRRTALPAPGGDEELCRLVARLMSQRLDRDRPLWECWVVEGLAGGRWALLSKVHHCMADGVAGTNLYNTLFDHAPEPSAAVADGWQAEAAPSTLRLTAGAVRDLMLSPADQLRLLSQALRHPARMVRRVAGTARGLIAIAQAVAVPASPSSLTGPIGRYRRYSIGRAGLADVMRVARHFHTSMNDVVLAAASGAFRTLLLQRGERPDAHSVRALVPVSVRRPGERGVHDNRISLMLPYLPVDIADPVRRLKAVHEHMTQLKTSREAEAGEAMTSLAAHEPFLPISWGIRMASHLPQRSIVTVTTNVPGPREPLFMLGRRIVEILPYVPIAVRLRTGVAILTYCDRIAFGVTADYDSAPEADLLARAIGTGIAELVALAPEPVEARPEPKPPAPAPRRRAPATRRPRATGRRAAATDRR
jgi:WS/DGAT/MGAT family acyltransferase